MSVLVSKRAVFGIVVLTLIAGIFLIWNRMTVSHHASLTACSDRSSQPEVVAFGDSLVTGFGAQTDGGFVTLAAQEIGVPIENMGKNGDTTAAALERSRAVAALNPTIVIILLGGNDALRRVPVLQVEQNLMMLIEQFTTNGAQVILLGVPGGLLFSDPYPDMFERLASASEKVVYVPNVLSGILGNRELMSDQIHPNQAGYQKIAERVVPAIREACARLSPE